MPISGISKVLENMLVSVLGTHSLKSWNIFSEENGDLTFRLKFKVVDTMDTHVQDIQPKDIDLPVHSSAIPSASNTISFKKKSSSQISRDKARAIQRNRQLKLDQLQSSFSSVETERAENELHENINFVVTPVMVKQDQNSMDCASTPVSAINKSFECPQVESVSLDSIKKLDSLENSVNPDQNLSDYSCASCISVNQSVEYPVTGSIVNLDTLKKLDDMEKNLCALNLQLSKKLSSDLAINKSADHT